MENVKYYIYIININFGFSKIKNFITEIYDTIITQGIVLLLSLIHISEPTRPY